MDNIMINLLNSKNKINNNAVIKCINMINNKLGENVFFNIIKNIKKQELYPSKFHGLYHSEKVCFFATCLSIMEDLNDVDLQIIIDAALYHDIGRQNDHEDDLHGFISSNKIEMVVENNIIYKDEENLNILKAIIDGHSRKEKYKEITAEDHDVTDYTRYSKLYDILKDADALDRTRFNVQDSAYLDTQFLRFENSKLLVEVAKSLNEYYKNIIQNNLIDSLNLESSDSKNIGCLHGIGFDIFKLLNILQYGILSSNELSKNQILNSRNFLGNNQQFWISVVDEYMLKDNSSGYSKFIKDGISLYCFVPKLIDGITTNIRSSVNDSGLPTKSKEHADEKFVYNKIPPENIYAILIPKARINDTVDKLNFMNCNMRYSIVLGKVNYYSSKIKKYFNFDVDREEVDNILNKYEEITNQYTADKSTIDDYYKTLDDLICEINKCIQKWIKDAILNMYKKDLSLSEIVDLILTNLRIDYKKLNSGDELLYCVDLTKKLDNETTKENVKK